MTDLLLCHHRDYIVCYYLTGDVSVMQIAVDQQSTSSASTSSASSSLPSEATNATAAVTLSAAGSEPQPAAGFVLNCISITVNFYYYITRSLANVETL